jgi:hypothetical protein
MGIIINTCQPHHQPCSFRKRFPTPHSTLRIIMSSNVSFNITNKEAERFHEGKANSHDALDSSAPYPFP